MRAKVCLATIASTGRDGHKTGLKRNAVALIDPGSDRSLISFDQLPKQVQIEARSFIDNPNQNNVHNIRLHNYAVIKTVNSETVADSFSITLNVTIGRWHGPIDVIVLQEDLNEKLIIGADFLNQHGAQLSFGTDPSMKLKPHTPIAFCHSTRNSFLEARHEGHIEIEVPKSFNGQHVLVQPIDHSNQQFTIASSVHRVDKNRIYVRYINVSNNRIKISKRQKLAEVSLLGQHDIIDDPLDVNIYSTSTDPTKKALKIDPGLTEEQRSVLIELLDKYKAAFSQSPDDRGRTDLVEHRIRLNTDQPLKQPPYRVPPAKRDIIIDKVNEMKAQDVLEDSNSPFAAPVVLIRKSNGEWRFCADYRQLNSITIKDAYPLPRIDDALDALRSNAYFSKLDLVSGFWQIVVAEADREKTAIATPAGLHQFKVMPYGLTNAPATFQRLMDRVLSGLTWDRCIVYMDDIIIFGKTFEQHNLNLESVLQRIIAANLKLNMAKCEFCASEIIYLGHRITKNGIGVDPAKVEAIDRLETPTNRQKLRRFLGMATYYKRFVEHFSWIAAPLTQLTSINREYKWTPECQAAFDQLKSALKSTPLLAAPDFTKPFQLSTDASKIGIGAVLEQDGQPIAYASRTCSVAEQNYQATEQEALAVIWAVRHFRHYVYGRELEILVDHKPLHDLKSNRHPEEPLGRLMLKLQGLNYKITYVPGKKNNVADVLSRDVAPSTDEDPQVNIEMREPDLTVNNNAIVMQDIDWLTEQASDPELARVLNALQHKRSAISHSEYRRQYSKLCINNGLVCRGDRVCVPTAQRHVQIKRFHEAHGHEQPDKLTKRMHALFFWPKMDTDIATYVQSCDGCQRAKDRPPNRPELGQIAPVTTSPLKFWSIDFQGPFRTSENGSRYIITAIDYGSKWVEAKATADCSAVTTAQFILENIILRHGPPEVIHTDQGTNFESKIVNELCALYNIKKSRSSPFHPEGNGAVERENRSLKSLLRAYTIDDQTDWDRHIPIIVNARNTTVHSATGFTPFEMVYGRSPDANPLATTPPDESSSEYIARLTQARKHIEKSARLRLKREQEKRKRAYEKSNRIASEDFKPGDLVLITNEGNHPGSSKKLEPKFIGPMQVVEANEQTCIVESDEKSYHKAVHKSRLRRYHVSNSEGGQSAPSPASTLSQQPNMSQQRRPRKSSTTVAKQKQQRTTTAVTQPHHTTRYGRVSKPVARFTSNTASLVVDQQS
jgi:transposase InsO family protein